jgi:hypothetical protein
LVLNESGIGLSRTAKGNNPAVVLLGLLIAGINVLQTLLLRGAVSHQREKCLELEIESLGAIKIGNKEGLVAGCDVAELRGFHINQ